MEPINPPGEQGGSPQALEAPGQPVVGTESPGHRDHQDTTPHMETAAPPMSEEDTNALILAQQKMIADQMKSEAAQVMEAENPLPQNIPVEVPTPAQPMPESVLHTPPEKTTFLIQVKDKIINFFKGVKKFLFPDKAPKPPRPTSFKNASRGEGSSISFKQQVGQGAGI